MPQIAFEKHSVSLLKIRSHFLLKWRYNLAKPKLTSIGRYINCLKNKHMLPTLTVKGFFVYCADKANSAVEAKFDWENALIDAAITSAVTFFSALGGGTAAGLDGLPGVKAAVIAAFAQFFVFLALKRGIVQRETKSG